MGSNQGRDRELIMSWDRDGSAPRGQGGYGSWSEPGFSKGTGLGPELEFRAWTVSGTESESGQGRILGCVWVTAGKWPGPELQGILLELQGVPMVLKVCPWS